jgi:hypothetical protein
MGSASTEKDQKLRQALGVSPSPNPRIQWLESVTLKPVARWLKTGDPHATIDRLFISEHVQDLRLIAAVAILISLVIVIFSCMYACFDVILWVLKHFIGDLTNYYFTELVYNFYKKGPLGLARHVINALYYVLLHIGRGILIF